MGSVEVNLLSTITLVIQMSKRQFFFFFSFMEFSLVKKFKN